MTKGMQRARCQQASWGFSFASSEECRALPTLTLALLGDALAGPPYLGPCVTRGGKPIRRPCLGYQATGVWKH